MTSLLLVIIYLAFISLGLPDSLLGAAWPSMYEELGAGISWAGAISMIIAAGTVVSSLASDRMTQLLGAGKVTAISVCMTAVALFGFSISPSFVFLCLWAIPYGLGAGSVDAALNNFLALHYPARHMSWLHCMWGVGCSIGPVVMSAAITGGFGWQGGYRTISILQFVLTVILFASLPLWKRKAAADDPLKPAHLPLPRIIQRPGVKEVLICFFCYSSVETTAGMWAASYCTLNRGISAETAAQWASIFYLGITIGRFICGFMTYRFNDRQMIRIGQALGLAGILCMLLPGPHMLLFAGLLLLGCGCAPTFPSLIHETPQNFGPALSQSIIGIQMAFSYMGTCLMSPLFGLIAEHISIGLYPVFLLVFLLLMIFMSERLHQKVSQPT